MPSQMCLADSRDLDVRRIQIRVLSFLFIVQKTSVRNNCCEIHVIYQYICTHSAYVAKLLTTLTAASVK